MAKSSNQKLKLLTLLNIFWQLTDEEHGLSIEDLIDKLSEHDIGAQRKALYDDFETLSFLGFEIEHYFDGKTPKYYLSSRMFSIPELKLLVDAVQSSKFISANKSLELISKLEKLTNIYQAQSLRREVYTFGRIKSMNESAFDNVDVIHKAMLENKKIRFKYFQWTVNKKQEFRRGGEEYEMSPWSLVWNNENYYLVAYDSEENTIKHFRVDKMKLIRIIRSSRDGENAYKKVDPAKYVSRLFGMYNGEDVTVTLQCENSMAGVIIDRFGKDVFISKIDNEHFNAVVDVTDSDQFLGWVISIGEAVKITSPQSVIDHMRELVQRLNQQYLNN